MAKGGSVWARPWFGQAQEKSWAYWGLFLADVREERGIEDVGDGAGAAGAGLGGAGRPTK